MTTPESFKFPDSGESYIAQYRGGPDDGQLEGRESVGRRLTEISDREAFMTGRYEISEHPDNGRDAVWVYVWVEPPT